MILKSDNNTVIWFDDLTTLATASVPEHNLDVWRDYVSNDSEGRGWWGIDGGIEAVRKTVELYGWKDGYKRGMEAIGSFKAPRLPQYKRKKVRADQGHALDIHSVMSGQLHRAWEASEKQHQNVLSMKGHVNILIDVSANGYVGSGSFFWRGAVGCILAKALIESGRHVRVMACDSTTGLGNNRCYRTINIVTVIKEFTAPLDLNRLFSMTALAGFYRYYYFKACIMIEDKVHGFGGAGELHAKDINHFLDDTPILVVKDIWDKKQANSKLQELSAKIEGGKYDGR